MWLNVLRFFTEAWQNCGVQIRYVKAELDVRRMQVPPKAATAIRIHGRSICEHKPSRLSLRELRLNMPQDRHPDAFRVATLKPEP